MVCPELPIGLDEIRQFEEMRQLLDAMLSENDIEDFVLWYYTPMARPFTRHLIANATVYDCMDELSAFRGAPPGLRQAESDLFSAADVVFTGGRSLYESKRTFHSSVHCFPSSIESEHFAVARTSAPDPIDQAPIAHPRIGFCGVIDERMDLALISTVAESHPSWQFVMVGPVVKISQADLPRSTNLHYLGGKSYDEIPHYMAGWNVAMLPFAKNESTRFISPTKTPEYLAAGLPVVSTSIADVVRPYGEQGLVEIADGANDFASAIEKLLQPENAAQRSIRLERTDAFLAKSSWDKTWRDMESLIQQSIAGKQGKDTTQEERMELSSAAD